MSATHPTSLRYEPGLDGLRAIACALVLLFHARAPYSLGGYVGVDLFFVLSGYLITRTWGDRPITQVGHFYKRRARRLLPALLTLLAIYLMVAPLVWPDRPHLRDAALAGFYLTSYSIPWIEAPRLLWHTWSLSVEVYFYALWPFVLWATRCAQRLHWLLFLYLAATVWRIHETGSASSADLYFRADFRFTGLILGSAIALLPQYRLQRIFLPAGLAGLLLLTATLEHRDPSFPLYAQTLAEWSSALCVLGATAHAGLLAAPAITYFGRISYGIYLWHYPVLQWCREQRFSWDQQLLIIVPAGIVLAAISYHTIESLFRAPHPTRRTRHSHSVGGESL